METEIEERGGERECVCVCESVCVCVSVCVTDVDVGPTLPIFSLFSWLIFYIII